MESEEGAAPLRLGDFILENTETILAAWEDFARRYWEGPLPASAALRNGAEKMLRAVVADMAHSQSAARQKSKSEGADAEEESEINRAAWGHALARVNDGFDIGRMVAEFRALRASVSRIWWDSVPTPHREQIDDMGDFNEALDQLVAASVAEFTDRVDRSRRLFLGMLGHDLRQPLQALRMLTAVLAKEPELLPPGTGDVVSRMEKCCDSTVALLSDLLDFTSSQLGCAMPVNIAASDLETICRDVVNEAEAAAPGRSFTLETAGDLAGEWDASRLRQLVSNLLSNARHHGAADHPVHVSLRGSADEATLSVHNMGVPIPKEAMATLFDPMVRLAAKGESRPQGSIGLGLYICRQIAIAHGGEIRVESSADEGTTFTVRLPKEPPADEVGSR